MSSHSPTQRFAFRQPGHGWIIALTGVLVSCVAGCGIVGSPIAPEDVGIEAKIRAHRQAEERRSAPEGQPISPTEESEVVLPPLRPVGTQ